MIFSIIIFEIALFVNVWKMQNIISLDANAFRPVALFNTARPFHPLNTCFLLTGNLNLSYDDNGLLFRLFTSTLKIQHALIRFVLVMFCAHIIIFCSLLQVQKKMVFCGHLGAPGAGEGWKGSNTNN